MRGDSRKGNRFQGDLFGGDSPLTKEEDKSLGYPVGPTKGAKKTIRDVDPILLKAEAFRSRISDRLGEKIHLHINNNRTSLISFKRRDGVLTLRLNAAFLEISETSIGELVLWIKSPRRGAPESIKNFVKTLPRQDSASPKKRLYAMTSAQVYDLKVLFHKVNNEFFDGQIKADITFGRDSSKQRVKVRRLGSFSHRHQLITIHPILDDKRVPEFVVEFIIYHEMLHALQPADHKRFHDKAFRTREREYPTYAKVMEWQKKNNKFLSGKIR